MPRPASSAAWTAAAAEQPGAGAHSPAIAAILRHHLPIVALDEFVATHANVPLATALNDFSALPLYARQEVAAAMPSS